METPIDIVTFQARLPASAAALPGAARAPDLKARSGGAPVEPQQGGGQQGKIPENG